jgi:hypothetical protein
MHLAKRLALLVPVLALLACGGSVVKVGPGDGGDDGGPNPACPSPPVVGSGASCNDPGLQCPTSYTIPTCDGSGGSTTVECTCGNGLWECPEIGGAPSCPAPPVCPDPTSVVQGNACSTDSTISCQSNIPITDCNGNNEGFLTCNCLGGVWACEEFGGPACEVDAGTTCPDPTTVFSGQGCATYGTICGGDPQSCGGGVVYDALQCVAGVWNVVASTNCEADAGIDAETVDGGKGI